MVDQQLLEKSQSEALDTLRGYCIERDDRLKPTVLPLLALTDTDWQAQATDLWMKRQTSILDAFTDETLGLIVTGQLKPRQLIWELIDPSHCEQLQL
jgi:hypothetical protein